MSSMLYNSTIQNSCEFIQKTVRSSGLNFSCQETPFSIFITVRKSQIKLRNGQSSPQDQNMCQTPTVSTSVNPAFVMREPAQKDLLAKNKSLEGAFNKLKLEYEDAIADSEIKYKVIGDLEEKLEDLMDILQKRDGEIKEIMEEKKTVESKLEQAVIEKKVFEKEKNKAVKKCDNFIFELDTANYTVIKLEKNFADTKLEVVSIRSEKK